MKKAIAKILTLVLLLNLLVLPATVNAATDITITEYVDLLQEVALNDPEDLYMLIEMFYDISTPAARQAMVDVWYDTWSGDLNENKETYTRFADYLDALQTFSDVVENYIEPNWTMTEVETNIGLASNDAAFDTAWGDLLSGPHLTGGDDFASIVSGIDYGTFDRGFYRMDTLFLMYQTLQIIPIIDEGKVVDFYFFETVDPWPDSIEQTGTGDYQELTFQNGLARKLVDQANMWLLAYTPARNELDDIESIAKGIKNFGEYYNDFDYVTDQADREVIFKYLNYYGFIDWTEVETKNKKNTVTEYTIADGVIAETVPQGALLFSDLDGYEWASTAIRQLFIADVIGGKDEDSYAPGDYVTRAEFAAMMVRMLDPQLPEDNMDYSEVFTDVATEEWYSDEVLAAYRAGYIKGIGGGLFAPDKVITREQMATMLGRVLADQGVEVPDEAAYEEIMAGFVDGDDVSSWAKTGSAMMAKLEVITGSTVDGLIKFLSKQYATRAESAVMLYRISTLVETKVELFIADGAEAETGDPFPTN